MSFFKWAEARSRALGLIDTKLVALSGICIGLLLAIWIPRILEINMWWFIGVGVASLLKVWSTIFIKD